MELIPFSHAKKKDLFSFHSIDDYHAYLASHPGGCTVAVKHYLSRIAENRHLNAFLEVFDEEALERASLLDEKRKSGGRLGKLHGVVVALKDILSYKGHKLSAASKDPAAFYGHLQCDRGRETAGGRCDHHRKE